MTAAVGVRAAGRADLPRILDIERSSFSEPWHDETFASLLDRDDVDLLVATVAATVVGYAVLWSAADEAELANLAVAPAMRGKGVGGALLDAGLEIVRDRGVRRVFLEVRASNEAAATLYGRFGFREIGVRRSYYRQPVEDARVLALELAVRPDPPQTQPTEA